MATLSDLLAQKAALEKQIVDAQREEKAAAIAQVKSLMAQYGLTPADINARGPAPRRAASSGAKVPAKYRDSATGDTWSGRGLQPKWLKAALAAGRSLSEFSI
ncbi:MAG: H-NS histone family protein [Burkholderiales bacterium]|nr:H-NS histone family protein [Burkholderiales bacterium]MDE2454348.1 H-NS histone family protein [Burkholderiales bacterium]